MRAFVFMAGANLADAFLMEFVEILAEGDRFHCVAVCNSTL